MTKINPLTDNDKMSELKKAVGKGTETMRRIYPDPKDGYAAFKTAAAIAAAAGIAAYSVPQKEVGEGFSVAVAVVGSRDRNAAGKMETGIKGVVLFPMPTLETFLGGADLPKGEDGKDTSAVGWIRKVAEKEASHVAFRELRDATTTEEFEQGGTNLPRTLDAYVEAHTRGGSGLDTEAFDAIWSELRKVLKGQMPDLVDVLPTKAEVLKGIRSKAYAEQEHAALESKGVFVFLAKNIINAGAKWKDDKGEADPIDTSEVQAWLDGRDSLKFPAKEIDFSVLEGLNLGIA